MIQREFQPLSSFALRCNARLLSDWAVCSHRVLRLMQYASYTECHGLGSAKVPLGGRIAPLTSQAETDKINIKIKLNPRPRVSEDEHAQRLIHAKQSRTYPRFNTKKQGELKGTLLR